MRIMIEQIKKERSEWERNDMSLQSAHTNLLDLEDYI